MKKTCPWMIALALLLSGCGELSYKRGASTQDLEAARKACAEASRDRPAEECLAAQGWTVKKLDDIDLFATAAVSPDNRNPGQFVIPAWVPVIPAPPAMPAPIATIPTASATALSAPPAAPATRSGATSSTRTSSVTTLPASASPAANTTAHTPAPPASPLDVYTISSWWKMGADREALAADTQACVAELGATHKPNAATQQVTRGFVVCMHGKGWKALRAVAG